MNQTNDLASSPNAIIRITIEEDLTSSFPADIRGNLLKLAGGALSFNLHSGIGNLVLVQPTGVLPSSEHKLSVGLLCLNDLLLDFQVDRRLNGAHESCSHIDALSTQTQSRSKPLPICEASGCDEWNLERLPGSAEEDKVRDVGFTDMAGTFETVNAQEVHPKVDGTLRMSNRRALMEDDNTDGLQLFDDRARAVSCSFHNLDSLVNSDLCICAVVRGIHRGKESDVDAEGLVGHGLAFSDLFPQVFGSRLCEGSEDAESASVANSRCKFSIANPLHATLNDWFFNAQGSGEFRFERHVGWFFLKEGLIK